MRPQDLRAQACLRTGLVAIFCPCHGSSFDSAGRVFKNKPAPSNLEIPPYRFAGDMTVVVGDDRAA